MLWITLKFATAVVNNPPLVNRSPNVPDAVIPFPGVAVHDALPLVSIVKVPSTIDGVTADRPVPLFWDIAIVPPPESAVAVLKYTDTFLLFTPLTNG